ncbi:hypothetical protein [Chitinophaga flava]|uniref:Uncharacterized protein n=1 Tax=Chitinophaga flava TaxID=2259036 RepID=A0A365XX65_9BACT|nr:hypothetical protein [Chitinophaga flava]RBL90175.1 hypothetical protein DF182_27290 [Chitinophaga flava]
MTPYQSANDIRDSSVCIKKAKEHIMNWRTAIKKVLPEPYNQLNIPNAVFIPFADILALAEKYKHLHGKEIAGVRGYFAIDQPYFEDKIRLMLVPVVEVSENYIVTYKDLILETTTTEYSPTGEKAEADVETSVYDFTKPCPDFCDTTSPFYTLQSEE